MSNNYLNNITISTASFFLASTATGFVANQLNLFKKVDDKTQTVSRNLFCTFGFTTCLILAIKRFSNGEFFSCSVNMIISGIFFGCIGQENTGISIQNEKIPTKATQITRYNWMDFHEYEYLITEGTLPEAAYNLENELEKMRLWLCIGLHKILFICGNPKSGKKSLVNEFYRRIRTGVYKKLKHWLLFKVRTSEFLSSKSVVSEIESLAKKFPNKVILFFDIQDNILEHPIYKELHRFNSLDIRFIFKNNTSLSNHYIYDIPVKELNVEQVKEYLTKIKIPELLIRKFELNPKTIDTVVKLAEKLMKVGKGSLCQMAVWILESTCERLRAKRYEETSFPSIKEIEILFVEESDIVQTYELEDRLPESTTNQAKSKIPTKLYGLDEVFENLWQTLSSQGSNSKVLLVGEKETGKASLIDKLQEFISKRNAPLLENKKMIFFNLIESSSSDAKLISVFNQNMRGLSAYPKDYIVIIKNIHILYESNQKLKSEFSSFIKLLNSKVCMIGTTNPVKRNLLSCHSKDYFKEIVIKPMKLEKVKDYLTDQKKELFELPYGVALDFATIDKVLTMVPWDETHPLSVVLDYLHRACVQALSSSKKFNDNDEKADRSSGLEVSNQVTVLPSHLHKIAL